MMCGKSLLCTVSAGTTSVAAGGTIPVGLILRRIGNGIRSGSSTISCIDNGYYLLSLNLTVAPSATGAITTTVNANGSAIAGASATQTVATANASTQLTITDVPVRVVCGEAVILSISISGAADVTSSMITVRKV